jgi:predicted metal-dependent hydrolase
MKQMVVKGIQIEISKKRIKNMYLKVLPPEGTVRVSAPIKMPDEAIKAFVLTKIDWISIQQNKIKNRHIRDNLNYESGDQVYLWGDIYQLEVVDTNSSGKLSIQGNRLILHSKPSSSVNQRERILNDYYRDVLKELIPILIDKWEPIIGVKANDWSIRDMKTRWGTCNIRSKKICLNLQLAKKPIKCLEYVVVHELVHLLEGSHNSVFKAYMDRFLPNWRTIKKEMNGAQ